MRDLDSRTTEPIDVLTVDVPYVAPLPTPALRRFRTINNQVRIFEVLRDVLRGSEAQLVFDDDPTSYAVVLGARAGHTGGRVSGALAVRATWTSADPPYPPAGTPVSIWFPHRDGIYGFRARTLGSERDGVTMGIPAEIVNYSRRSAPRYTVPAQIGVRLSLSVADRPSIDLPLVTLSIGGLSVAAHASLRFVVGTSVLADLKLPSGPPRSIVVNCRVVKRHDDRRNEVGFAFVDLKQSDRLALERVLASLHPDEGMTVRTLPALETIPPEVASDAVTHDSDPLGEL